MSELFIKPYANGKYGVEVDAFKEFGVKMGDNFLNTLLQPVPMKDYLTNSSRLEDGVRVNVSNPKKNSRNLTLTFVVQETKGKSLRDNLNAFYAFLYGGRIAIRVPKVTNEVFYLVYTGKNITFGMSLDRTTAKVSLKFDEPNPSMRM